MRFDTRFKPSRRMTELIARHGAAGRGMPLSAQILYSLKSTCLMNTILPLSFLTTL
jgi:hypothetical protein